jgi:hypothetical protein
MRGMQPNSDKLHNEAKKKKGCISTSKLHKQMHLKQNEAAQMDVSFLLKLHKRKTDASEQEQNFRRN